MAPAASTAAYLYHHVVLPPQLPQQDDTDPAHERSLFEMVIKALEHLMVIVDKNYTDKVTCAISTIKNVRDSRDVHGTVSEVQFENILSSLTSGKIKGLVPLEVKAQNAGILISRDETHINFEFFELSPTNEAAMRSKRLMRTFPGYASRIAIEKMRNPSLQKSIASFIAKVATQSAPGFQPQARKNGKDENEDRDTTAPQLVTDLLLTITTAHGEATVVSRITKATLEDVLWSDCLHPWRRSPLWLLIRVSLQLCFTRTAFKPLSSGNVYKAFMICMVSQILDLAKSNWSELGSETVHNISAKLIQRLRKFELLKQSGCLCPGWTDSIKDHLLNAHTVIAQHWQSCMQNSKSKINTAIVESIRPSNDLDMELPALDTFLLETRTRRHNRLSSIFKPSSRFSSFPAATFPKILDGSDHDKYFCLQAVEEWVEQHLQTWISLHLNDTETCGQLRSLIENYFVTASAAYTAIPVSMSIMYLTIAELWIACDKSACAQYFLLREYDHELCITEFQCLVLPLKHHMERLHEIEQYIQSRRKAANSHLPSLYRSFGHQSSFAVKYFDQSKDLQATLSKIERDAERKRAQKCQELRNLKTNYNNLMKQYNSKTCDSETYVYNRRHGYTTTRHPSWCSRCTCKKQADNLSIHIYEWPLSIDTDVAKATVFELKIPQAFSDWRDTSAYITSKVLGHIDLTAKKPSCSYTLTQHHDLSHMLSSSYHRRRTKLITSPRSVAKGILLQTKKHWWETNQARLSSWYNQWGLSYVTTATPPELELPRPTLARMLAIRSKHGDFAWYHKKFSHDDAKLECSCGRAKTPEHIVFCRKTTAAAIFRKWPQRPMAPPCTTKEGINYLDDLLSQPRDFEAFLEITKFYSDICWR